MKLVVILIIGFIAIAGARVCPQAQENSDASRQQWVEERYKEAVSIRPGMNRADLMKLFAEDGGLQSVPASRYVLKSCHLIKIEVKFATPYGVNYKPTPDQDLKITEVSRPYLEPEDVD